MQEVHFMNCCMCKKIIEEGQNHSDYSFYGNYRPICGDCRDALNSLLAIREKKKKEGKEYINNLLATNQYDPDIVCELKSAMGMHITPEEKTAVKKFLSELKEEKNKRTREEYRVQEEKRKEQLNGTGFSVVGIIFLIIAVILYVISINPLDKGTAELLGTPAIINIQATVFCAASFIASVICCACKGLIKYLNR